MKVFKDIRFYLGAGLLIALVAVMWSLPMDLNAAGANGEALPDAASDTANAKAKPESPGGERGMSGIIGKGGDGGAKQKKIQGYLRGKYKGLKKGVLGARAEYRFEDGSIEDIYMSGDFTPPGYAKRADVDKDIRARSRAFLEEEKDLFGFIDLQNELGGGEKVVTEHIPGTRVLKEIRYHMEVEGLRVSGSTFFFVFTEDGEPISMNSYPKHVSLEARAAAKRFRAEGVNAAYIKDAVKADIVKRGVPQSSIDRLEFVTEPRVFLVETEPYVTWSLSVYYPGHGEDLGGWAYGFNAFTGEVINRYSTIHPEPPYDGEPNEL